MLNTLRLWLDRWRLFRHQRPELDAILAGARPDAALTARLYWLASLIRWLHESRRAGDVPERDGKSDDTELPRPVLRLRFVLQVLERHPDWRERVGATLRSLIHDIDTVDLFVDVGLPREFSLISELGDRLVTRLLPPDPGSKELGVWFRALFPDPEAAGWIAEIDPATMARLLDLVTATTDTGWNTLPSELARAMRTLNAQIQAVGMSTAIRTRMGSDAPFYALGRRTEAFLDVLPGELAATEANLLRATLDQCFRAAEEAFRHLDEHGVSIKIVYQLTRLQAQVLRAEMLVDLLLNPGERAQQASRLVATLVTEAHAQQSTRRLFSQATALLARKMTERSAETGEHYITRNRDEYFSMLRHALGGGALTGLTTLCKFAIGHLGLIRFYEGLAASFNYAASFVAIQLAGFTLATKQPAMTAPALAARMRELTRPEHLQALVDEIICMIRSQMAAIAGNLLAVAPVTLVLALLVRVVAGQHMLDADKAQYVISSLSFTGPSLIFAAFTGVLLWLSSLVAGWADNWFTLHRIAPRICGSRALQAVFGPRLVGWWARFWEQNISGLAGNIALGFMLGMVPVVAWFLGLPIDVRHVTLSTGQLTLAVVSLGWESLLTAGFWLALLGIAGIGLLNVTVSFALALVLAIRARNVRAPERRMLYRALLVRLIREPRSFVLPPREGGAADNGKATSAD